MECERIVFSVHAFRRLDQRGLKPVDVEDAVRNGEVIREYLDDAPWPSYLVFGTIGGRTIHAVVARDPGSGNCVVITTYEPDPTVWNSDLKTRRS